MLGVAAPLVVSVAVWAVTRSPYALLFAALGPVVAVAGVADQRISARELGRLMEVLGSPITLDQAEEAVRSIDSDGDGLISLEEFAAYLESARN